MGLFSRFKRQLLDVIEWKDASKDTVVYRYPLNERDEIMNSSTLVVRASQVAVFVHKGQIADTFSAGTYKLATENIPVITKLLSLPTGFNSPIKAEVYFINTKQFTGQKWGTQNPITLRDNDFGNIRIKGFGVYSFRVDDAPKFMKEMFGTNEVFKTEDVAGQIKPLLLQSIADTIAESKISALDLAASYTEFGEKVVANSQQKFNDFGLKLCDVVIENISFPEDVEKALDERTKLGVLEDKMGTYTQYQAANAIKEAASNPNGNNLAGLGVGLGAGGMMGNIFAENFTTQNKPNQKEKMLCNKCGAEMKLNAKFCPECGEKQGLSCPKCNATISKKAKFCPECGESMVKKCKCGAEVKNGAKFCPECGEKL